MAESNDFYFTFLQRKREKQFLPFEIVTDAGTRVGVKRRYGFGFNQQYVLVLDDRDLPMRVWYDHIITVENLPVESRS